MGSNKYPPAKKCPWCKKPLMYLYGSWECPRCGQLPNTELVPLKAKKIGKKRFTPTPTQRANVGKAKGRAKKAGTR